MKLARKLVWKLANKTCWIARKLVKLAFSVLPCREQAEGYGWPGKGREGRWGRRPGGSRVDGRGLYIARRENGREDEDGKGDKMEKRYGWMVGGHEYKWRREGGEKWEGGRGSRHPESKK